MALIVSVASLCGVALFGFICAALGYRLLRAARLDLQIVAESLLVAIGLGFISFEAGLALAEFFSPIRVAVVVLLAATAGLGASEWPAVLRMIAGIFLRIAHRSLSERILPAVVAVVLLLEGLTAMAPMTGSDALHYHFVAPLHVLQAGFHPDFFLTSSFLTGQGHLLILAGLALRSEHLATGLLFLAGALAALGAACLARVWVSYSWAWAVALGFLLNPVVFWQISTAGAPDLWMAFLSVVCVLLIGYSRNDASPALACVCGVFAGGVAGTKYIGCIFAAALLVAFLWESRSLKRSALFLAGAFAAGVWPYARNFLWTGDAVFPFGAQWFMPSTVNAYALASILESTVVRSQRTLATMWRFPLFAVVNRGDLGFWEFFGPLCLAFIPLFVLKNKRTAQWRVALIVALVACVGVGLTSGMARYTLAIFPIALALAFAGAASVTAAQSKPMRSVILASIAGFLLVGAGGFAVYSLPALRVATGVMGRQDYLLQRSPEYALSEFVNRSLAGKEAEGKALVFFRHLYYLRAPHLYGNPEDSWAVDPARLSTPEAWREFLRNNRIRWIVRAPDYPAVIAGPLEEMEHDGTLHSIARQDVSTFQGMRILGIRKTVPVVILRVND